MDLNRRTFILGAGALVVPAIGSAAMGAPQNGGEMYGLISKLMALPGQRQALVTILLEVSREMPGCLSYVVALDTADADAIWISEVWESQSSHEASLALPTVRQAMVKGRPLIAGFGDRVVTTPVGGPGLPASRH